jgi:hypothetical protein
MGVIVRYIDLSVSCAENTFFNSFLSSRDVKRKFNADMALTGEKHPSGLQRNMVGASGLESSP